MERVFFGEGVEGKLLQQFDLLVNAIMKSKKLEIVIAGVLVLVLGQQGRAQQGQAQQDPDHQKTAGEIYLHAVDGMVFVESLDKEGNPFNRGSGFFIVPGLVLTAFENIEGASALRIELPGGERQKLTEVAGWNRTGDWALLQVDAADVMDPHIVKAGVNIGDQDYLMDAPVEGGRAIHPAEIMGMRKASTGSRRIYISWINDWQSVGSPLIDRKGQVVGMLGGTPVAGLEVKTGQKTIIGNFPGVIGKVASLMVVPIFDVAPIPPPGKPVTLATLAGQGLFAGPVASDTLVITGSLCSEYHFDPKHFPICKLASGEISKKQQTVTVMLAWSFEKDQKVVAESRLYDSENHKVGEPIVKQVNLKRGGPNLSDSAFSIASLQPGVYRLDVLVGDSVQWRMNFVVTE